MNTTTTLSLEAVLAARRRLDGAVTFTPCSKSTGLSQLLGREIFCKMECAQPTGSFKERGARNALSLLGAQRETRGVIAASAGNHALGLARHARSFGLPLTVVMPRSAARIKIERCRRCGAQVILHGKTYNEVGLHATELARQQGLAYIHPFDDLDVIAGQGTVALEVIEQVPQLDAILVPVGGGGLLAGVTTVLRAVKPEVTIIGVEPEGAACFCGALEQSKPVHVKTRDTLADGLAVAEAGSRSYAIAAPHVDRVLTVPEAAIAHAIRLLARIEGAVVEGAGAVGLAALLISSNLPELERKRVVLVVTGGNIDPFVHRRVLEQPASGLVELAKP